jgi:predicted acetyltransferase
MTAAFEIRAATAEDWPAYMETMTSAFGDPMSAEGQALWERNIDFSKMLVAVERSASPGSERETIVGTAGWIPFGMAVPGGELPVAGVTMVTVRPTHRRRGILRQLMRRQLDDLHAQGVAVASLWASESAIYQRFGYGLGHLLGRIEIDPRRAEFLGKSEPVGRVRLVSEAEALELLPAVYERARAAIPGSFKRSRLWWETRKLADPEAQRHGGSPMFRAILDLGGRPEGYALYRHYVSWGSDGMPTTTVQVLEALGATPTATREIWRYLFGLDLVAKVWTHRLHAGHPLFFALEDLRALHLTTADGTWLRLVDVGAALTARQYGGGAGAGGVLTFELADAFCPWNAGIWTLETGQTASSGPSTTSAQRSSSAPELRLSAAELAAMYLGTVTCSSLLAAGRVEELKPGAAARADLLFRSEVAPWCLDDF